MSRKETLIELRRLLEEMETKLPPVVDNVSIAKARVKKIKKLINKE